MNLRQIAGLLSLSLAGLAGSAANGQPSAATLTGAAGEVKLITLDPGHFHAALVQRTMYAQIAPVVHVYLKYLVDSKLPAWEVPNMLAKYRTTTAALELAR